MMGLYLVTGAAGFIGAALAKKLLGDGHGVVAIDNLSTGARENVPAGVHFFEADCQDPDPYLIIPQDQYDAIFHIAGQSSGEISFDNPTYDLSSNTGSTLRLLEFSLQNGCRRFIYASTMSVYGEKPDRPTKETDELKPESFYGVGKLASEHYLRIYEQFGIRSTSLRLFNVFGPGQNMTNLRQGMVSIFMAQMIQNGHIHIKGSKDRYRDFVFIDDVVDAFTACLNSSKAHGEVLNIASGVRTTVEALVDILTELYPGRVSREFSGSTSGDVHGLYADICMARKTLSYSPSIDLRTGLSRMLKWAIESGK